jgi:putative phage-type endonuclease
MTIDCEQGTAFWRELRRGLVTASRCADVIATIKKGKEEAAPRRNYRWELICEILTGQPTEQFVTREMQWGADQEPFARAAYEMEQDVMVETCGFVIHPEIPRFGASPDGLVGSDGMIQIKCPNTSTHLTWMVSGSIPVEHAVQMLAELSCTGRQWNDFVSFDPRLPKHLQLYIRRFTRKHVLVEKLESQVVHFNAEVDEMLAQLPQLGEGQPIVGLLDPMPDDEVNL